MKLAQQIGGWPNSLVPLELCRTPTCSLGQLSQPAAQNNIDKLVEEGILEEITGRQRGRVYLASKVIRIVEDDEVQQLPLKFSRST